MAQVIYTLLKYSKAPPFFCCPFRVSKLHHRPKTVNVYTNIRNVLNLTDKIHKYGFLRDWLIGHNASKMQPALPRSLNVYEICPIC